MRKNLGRRDVLHWTAGLSLGLLIHGRSAAQVGNTVDILGLHVPKDIAGIKLPSKPLNLLKLLAAILALEKDADKRGFERSSLMPRSAPPLANSDASLYQAALPRLVSLIDRSERDDIAFADQAGELLADLNASEHVVPDALKERAKISPRRDFASLKSEYGALFASAVVRPEDSETIQWHVNAMRTFRQRYEAVGAQVRVPWYFIGAIHGLESSFNFRSHLHNGDFPLSARTRQVPSGRPTVWMPPADWESSAKDALRFLGFTGQVDWSLERTLYRLEAYNGFGYRRYGVPTPYLWSFSTHYDRGKFVSDGRWSPLARSRQCGAAVLMKSLADSGDITPA